MDWNQVEGNWKQVRGNVKKQWGKLTEDKKFPPKLVPEFIVFVRVPKWLSILDDRPSRFAEFFQKPES